MSTTPYLKPDNLKAAYDASVKYMKPVHQPFDEFERLASNKPHPQVKDPYPKDTDGTLAAIIQDQPRRTIQQLPTGKINSPDPREWLTTVIDYYVNNQMVPRMRAQAEPLQKCWAMGSKALTFGCQPSMTMLCGEGDELYADFKLPDVRALLFEAHKLSFYDCTHYFIEAYYQVGDLDRIIDQYKAAKAMGIDTHWHTDVLERAKTEIEKLKDDSKNYDQKSRNIDAEGILIVHAMQYGKGAIQYSFVPALCDPNNNSKATAAGAIARDKPNMDPRGIPNGQILYATVTLSNPCGRGVVELSGGTQNFIDSSMQMYRYSSAYNMDPTLLLKGVSKSKAKMGIGKTIESPAGTDYDVRPIPIETQAMANYPTTMQMARQQILFLNNATDTSITSDQGGQSASKTPAGVKAQQASLGISDNHFRKQVEAWWQEVIASSVNIELNEKSGLMEIQLDKETGEKLLGMVDQYPELMEMLDPDTLMFTLDLDTVQDVVFEFSVDASSTQKQDNQAQLDALGGIAAQIDSSQLLQGLMAQAPDKVTALWNAMVAASGIEDPEKLKFTDEDVQALQQQQQEQMQAQQQMEQEQMAMQEQQAQAQQAAEAEAHQQQLAMKQQEHAMKLEQSQQSHQQALEMGQAKANQATALGEQKIVAAGGKLPKKPKDTVVPEAQPEGSEPIQGQPVAADPAQSGATPPADMPNMDGQVQQEEIDVLTTDEQGVIDRLFKEGVPEYAIEQAVKDMREGLPPEDVLQKALAALQFEQGQAE